jgi:hypothetical protein
MKVLPSIEALSASIDERLLAELEIQRALEKLACARALVDRADRLLHVVVDGTTGTARREADEPAVAGALYEHLLAIVRKKQHR